MDRLSRAAVFLGLRWCAGAASAWAQCPTTITDCASPTYDNLSANTFTVTGGYVAPSALSSYVESSELTITLGTASGAILGAWPNLYFAPSPAFTGTPTINGASVSQLEFVRGGTNYTFLGATTTSIGLSSSEDLPIEFSNNGYQTRLYIDPAYGNVGIGTTTPGARLDVASQSILIEQSYTPASSGVACTKGTISWDTSYVYVCVATNTWERAAISTW